MDVETWTPKRGRRSMDVEAWTLKHGR